MVRESNELTLKAKSVADSAVPGFAPVRRASQPSSFFGRFLKLKPSKVPIADGAIRRAKAVMAHRPSGYLLSLIVMVVIPSLVAILYLVFIASDQYVAEARFAVRTLPSESVSGENILSSLSSLGSIGGAAIPSIGGQDPFIVTSYIHSRAIIDDLSKTLNLHEIFRRPGADFWARLKSDASPEDLVDYWDQMVTTNIDPPSSIVTVSVRAFRPEDALMLSRAIISASEKLVNEVSARARNDAMSRAELEVRRNEGRVRQALQDLRDYRNGQGFIDPVTAATSTSKLLLEMMAEKIRVQNDLFVASKAMSSDAPTVQTLKTRVESLDNQIDQLKSKLTGTAAEKAISNSLAKFEELELKRIFAEKLYTISQDALERARARAERQNLYISVFVPPSLPEDAKFPERLGLSFVIPISLLIIWGIFALIGAAIEDHRL